MFPPPNILDEGGHFTEIRNEIKAILVGNGVTMGEAVRRLSEKYGWSASIPNFSEKLRRGSLKYREARELADVLGFELVWKKREGTP